MTFKELYDRPEITPKTLHAIISIIRITIFILSFILQLKFMTDVKLKPRVMFMDPTHKDLRKE